MSLDSSFVLTEFLDDSSDHAADLEGAVTRASHAVLQPLERLWVVALRCGSLVVPKTYRQHLQRQVWGATYSNRLSAMKAVPGREGTHPGVEALGD